MGKNKGTKMSFGEFIGGAPGADPDALPKGPKERDPEDDGAFRRRPRREDMTQDYEPSRSDADASWRRGGPPPQPDDQKGFDGGGYDDRRGGGYEDRRGGRYDDRRGGGYDDRRGRGYDDRRGGGYDDRRGGDYGDRRGGDYGDRRGGYDDRRGGDYDDRRGSGGSYGRHDDSRGGGGGFGYKDRGGGYGGGRYERGDRFEGDNRYDDRDRFGGGDRSGDRGSSAPSGERPKLNLQKRSTPVERDTADVQKSKADPFGGASAVDTASKLRELDIKDKKNNNNEVEAANKEKEETPEVDEPGNSVDAEENIHDEPAGEETVERAALDELPSNEAEETKGEAEVVGEESEERGEGSTDKRRDRKKNREPKIVNSRAALLEATPVVSRDSNNRHERGERDRERAPRGPPPVVNKRFEAMAEEEREKLREREDRRRNFGPPEPANSRFAAAAEADRSYRDDEHGPPVLQNSRFAAAAEADRSERPPPEPRGPPPVQNSRFAAAAAEAERQDFERDERRRDRDTFYRDEGPPQLQNSRFAAAVAADEDYIPEDRRRGPPTQDRFGGREGGRYDDRRGGHGGRGGYGGYDDRRGGNSDRRAGSGYDDRYDDRDARDRRGADYADDHGRSRVSEILKPKERTLDENVLKPPEPKAPEHADNMLKIPEPKAAVHEENILKIPTKIKDDEEEELRSKKENEVAAHKAEEAQLEAAKIADIAAAQEEALATFVSGNLQGEDLKSWCVDRGAALPPVERLIFHLLQEKEQKNPDPECPWADPSKYGSALVSLVEDDLSKQMQVLWAVQKYCNKLGFPKLNEEYLVQSMFRSMYKYDLVIDDAFLEWKEDESDENNDGKLTAVVQTVDWFNWLEEDDEDGEEDYEEE